MPHCRSSVAARLAAGLCFGLVLVIAACATTRGISEIADPPCRVIRQDKEEAVFGDDQDNVRIEIEKAKISKRLFNLAIYYKTFFPEGETIRSGDVERYLRVDGRNAYKVVFRPKYIRKRTRYKKGQEIPPGHKLKTETDPATGKPRKVLYSPIVKRYRTLYLVEGDEYLYYILLRADGESAPAAQKEFEQFVHEGITYQ